LIEFLPCSLRFAIDRWNYINTEKSTIDYLFNGIGISEGHTYRGRDAKGNMIKTGKESCDIHWVLIIGQSEINGQCRLLVRNSWGTNDSGYSTDWLPRANGNLWIDEETLSQNTFEYALIKN